MPPKDQSKSHVPGPSFSKPQKSHKTKLPNNWPASITYLTVPRISSQLSLASLFALSINPKSLAPSTPSPLVSILPITSPSTHPAIGQFGLFATRNLAPGTFICDYLGRYHALTPEDTDSESDYDLVLDRDAGVGVDARYAGNEARMVNDYRGIGERASVEFRERTIEGAERRMGLWVVRRKGWGGVKKGEELLISYGKGFWQGRKGEDE